jgi:hypothetical protein
VVKLRRALVNFAIVRHIVDYFFVENVHSSHFFVDQGEVLHVLRRVLDHGLGQGPLLPELRIRLHLAIYLILFRVHLPKVLLQQVIQTDVDISIVIQLKKVRDEPVRDLRIENKVANEVVLANEGAGILAEVVEDLHHLVGFHDLFEAVQTGVDGAEIDEETFVREVYLDQLHVSVLGEALAVHAQDRSVFLLRRVHDRLGQLLHFPRLRYHVVARCLHSYLVDLLGEKVLILLLELSSHFINIYFLFFLI